MGILIHCKSIPLKFPLASKGKGKGKKTTAPAEDVTDYGKAVAALKSDSKDSSKKKKRQPKVL